ncbi:hypothetical protein V8E53_010883 [Lactarius tabidus]
MLQGEMEVWVVEYRHLGGCVPFPSLNIVHYRGNSLISYCVPGRKRRFEWGFPNMVYTAARWGQTRANSHSSSASLICPLVSDEGENHLLLPFDHLFLMYVPSASSFTTCSDISPAREGPSAEVIACVALLFGLFLDPVFAARRSKEPEVDPEQF